METRSKTAARKAEAEKKEEQAGQQSSSFIGNFYSYIVEPVLTMTVMPFIVMFFIYFNLKNADEKEAQLGNLSTFVSQHFNGDYLQLVFAIFKATFFPTQFGFGIVLGFIVFQALLAKILPGKFVTGQTSAKGYTPTYYANGLVSYLVTMATYVAGTIFIASPTFVVNRFDEIIGAMNATCLLLSLILFIKAKFHPNSDCEETGHYLCDFLWGIELYPRFANIDVKWFLTSRICMTGWALIVVTCWQANLERFGFQTGTAVTNFLQLFYVTKCFIVENILINSNDNVFLRAGFYVVFIWSTFIPGLYTLTSQYLATRPGYEISPSYATILALTGLFLIVTQLLADVDKTLVRRSNGKVSIFGANPEVIRAKYLRECDGREVDSILLAGGFWRFSRHYAYFAEIAMVLCWSLPAGFSSSLPYVYFMFLVPLLASRAISDDERCAKKYGDAWFMYTKRVPYRILPYVF